MCYKVSEKPTCIDVMLTNKFCSFQNSCANETSLSEGPLLSLKQFLTTKSPLKIIKSDFYLMLNALFVLEILKFLPFYVTELQYTYFPIVEGNQAMTFGQLIKYNMYFSS